MAVEPVRSQKTTLMVLRCSRAGASASSGAPQAEQKRASSAFSLPQLGQATMGPSLGPALAAPATVAFDID